MNDIKISVVLIVYNHEQYVRQAMDSILMQEVDFKYEIIVGEDKSTDCSREILREYKDKYPDRIVLLFHKRNVGATKNIYSAFRKARGEYITCLEGDDYWIDPKKLQRQVDFLDRNLEYIGVSHIIEARDQQGNYISRHPSSEKIIDKDVTADLFLRGYYFSAVATVFRNIFINRTEDYSVYYKAHPVVGDFTLCMLLLDKGKIKVLDEVMSVYRCRRAEGESNYNSLSNPLKQYMDHINLLNAVDRYFKGKYDFSQEYIRRSTGIFLHIMKEYNDFYTYFRLIPHKIKVKFWIMLPVNVMKAVLFHYNVLRDNDEHSSSNQ